MDNLKLEVIRNPVIVYPGALLSGEDAKGSLVEGYIQFDLAHSCDVNIKVRLMGTERHNKMLQHDQKKGEIELIDVGQRLPLFHIETDLVYMFTGGKVPCSPSLTLEPGNHIFAFSGRIPHSTPSSESNSYVTTTYEAVAIAHGKCNSGWLKTAVNRSATQAFEVRVQPSAAGPNEVNKLDLRLLPISGSEEDAPVKAYARSPNGRLGGCMELDLVVFGPIASDLKVVTISLILEQYCIISSKRDGKFERLLCSKTLSEKQDLLPTRHGQEDEEADTSIAASNGDRKRHLNGRSHYTSYATLTLRSHFPNVGSMANPGDHMHDWIVSTPEKTHTNIRFSHKLRLKVGLVGTARFIEHSGEIWEFESEVVLVDSRLKSEDVILPSYSSNIRRVTDLGPPRKNSLITDEL